MASSATIDVDEFHDIDTRDGGMDTLDFQDIPHDSPAKDKGQTHEFTNFPHSAADSDDEGEDDQAKLLKESKQSSSFWTFAYYQQFFDVETSQVGQRILGSMVPRPGRNYLVKQIRPNPDLYGPFWICTTLVFTTAIAGNLANYFSMAGKDYKWQYDFHKVSLAATAIFSYWWLIPLILFGVLWWRGSQAKFTFLEMICVYGYSLAIYVPISVLWAIQVSWLQWTLVVVGAVLSGSVLLFTFWPAVSEDNKKIAIAVMIFIFVMHLALAAGFVLYFFHVPSPDTSASKVTNTTISTISPHEPPRKLESSNVKANNLPQSATTSDKRPGTPSAQDKAGGGNHDQELPGENSMNKQKDSPAAPGTKESSLKQNQNDGATKPDGSANTGGTEGETLGKSAQPQEAEKVKSEKLNSSEAKETGPGSQGDTKEPGNWVHVKERGTRESRIPQRSKRGPV